MKAFRGRPKFYPVEVVRDQVYSHVGRTARLADLYLPSMPGAQAPVIIWVHGGGWRIGDRNLAPDLSQFIAARGFAIVSFDYRLSDEAIFPAPIEDMKTVVRWVRSIAATYNLSTTKIGLWGSSAGAHIASCAALSEEHQFLTDEHSGFSSQVQAVLNGYGPTDLSLIDAGRPAPDAKPADVESVVVPNLLPAGHPDSFESRFLGVTVSNSATQVSLANPVNYVREGASPFLILHGLHDPLVPCQQSQLLFDALCTAGNDVNFLGLERLGHGFFMNATLDAVDPGNIELHQSEAAAKSSFATTLQHIPFGFDLVEHFFRIHLAT